MASLFFTMKTLKAAAAAALYEPRGPDVTLSVSLRWFREVNSRTQQVNAHLYTCSNVHLIIDLLTWREENLSNAA